MHSSGEWTLRMLVLTLLISPLRQWTGWPVLFRLRRMLGLYAFFYCCIHLLSFCQFYTGWAPAALLEELLERPYITAGFFAWLLMVPLAMTSTRAMQRRLGRRWVRLHRAIYPAAVLGCVHLVWQARSDIGEALVYSAIVAVLLGWRVRRFGRRRSPVLQTR
jgi:sulfoxide reductase heme-binding subunit YedZ